MTSMISGTAPGRLDIAERWGTTLGDDWTIAPRAPVPVAPQFPPGWRIPPSESPTVPRLQESLRQIKDWTGWSSRALAEATGTTHPTVESILHGRSRLPRVPGLARRVVALHELVSRLRVVVAGDRAELTRVLTEEPSRGGPSALTVLGSGEVPAAYLSALDVLRPPRVGAMMRGRFPSRPGEASVALDDA